MKEWYLLTPDSEPDSFSEVLDSDIATSILLYTSDLSTCKEIRCIIQGNTADTQLKSVERMGLFQRGTVKAGMYVFFENRYWLIYGYPGTNGVYEKAVMILCQYQLRWQNSKGDIIERWCNCTSASKYDKGETGNHTITLSSDTFTLLLPGDDEIPGLDGKRVMIDNRKSNPPKVYKVTRCDNILYDYGDEHGRVVSFIAGKEEFNPASDNQELRICDYHSPAFSPALSDETSDLSASISGGNKIRIGRPKTWTVIFKNTAGYEITDAKFVWNVVSNFEINHTISDNKIQLKIDGEKFTGSSFFIQILILKNGVYSVIAENKVTVVDELY